MPRSAADADLIRAHPRSLALLVVDDSPINRLVAAELLRHHGHRVTEAADGGEAVALAQSERFDAILMDVSMPGIDGVDATRMIRALPDDRRAAVPIIATTAHAFPEDTARLLGLGFSGVLIKPVDEALLLATLADTACAPPARPAMGRPGGLVDVTGLQARLGHMAAPQVEDFLNGLREAMAHDLDALDAAAAAGRPNDVGRAAHRIAGAAAHFGLSALRDAAIDLERRLRGGAVDTAEAGALRVLWARTSRELASAAARPAAVVAPPV